MEVKGPHGRQIAQFLPWLVLLLTSVRPLSVNHVFMSSYQVTSVKEREGV